MKKPFTKRKIVIALAGLLAAFLFSGSASTVSAAGDYYDGEKDSHLTGTSASESDKENGPGTIVEYKAEKVASFVTIDNYQPNNQHIADYANGKCKSGWTVKLANGSWVNYANYNGILKSSVPVPSSWPESLHCVIDSNGCLRYKCASCRGYCYCIDAELYGYYDIDGALTITGWTSQVVYCNNCTPLSKWNDIYGAIPAEYRSGWTVGATDGRVTGKGFIPDAPDTTYGYHGVYVYKNLLRYKYFQDGGFQQISDITLAFDPGILEYTDGVDFYNQLKSKTGQRIGNTGRYVLDADGEPCVEIVNKVTNNVAVPFGYHDYKAYHEYINFEKWRFSKNKNCIHTAENQDVYYSFVYNGKKLGKAGLGFEGYGYLNESKCGFNYQPGGLGYCADCHEMVTALTYASPETLSTVRRVRNGTGYLYVCPVQSEHHKKCHSMVLDGREFKYLKGHVENEWEFLHACTESCVNQYYLQFESNSPDPTFFPNSTYQVGGYFYNVFEEGKNVLYTPEGQSRPFSFKDKTVLENGNVIMADITPTKSRNNVDEPKFNSRGYIFKEWELWNGSSWVSVGANPTWQSIVSKIGETSDLLKNDGGTIRLRATWSTPAAVLKVVDGDTLVGNNVAAADVVGSYNVPFMRSTTVDIPGNKTGVLSFDAGSGVANPADMGITALWTSFSNYSGNKGVFDASTRRYANLESTNGRIDYAIANYSWQTITLPSVSKSGSVFIGWYTGQNGTGDFCGRAGAPYTPRGSATLYGYWQPDAMTIGAVVTDHISGKSKVEWRYNNSDIYGTVFYKIYRADGALASASSGGTLLTNGTDVGSTVVETPIAIAETTSSGSYTVQNEGVYEITLKGEAGRGITGALGGKGAVYKITMLLKKGDVLQYNISATSGNYGGGSANRFRAGNGTEGNAYNGGNATVLTLLRNGTTHTVAVASGGGGGMVLASGVGIAGGDAVQSLVLNGAKTAVADPYPGVLDWEEGGGRRVYLALTSGGGGGFYSGSAGAGMTSKHLHGSGCFHTHTAGEGNLVSGTALAADAVYSVAGGCYTQSATVTCGTFNNKVKTHGYWHCDSCGYNVGESNYGGWDHHMCHGVEVIGGLRHIENYEWRCSNYDVCHTAGNQNAAHTTTYYTLGCGLEGGCICSLGPNWGDNIMSGTDYYYAYPSTGGSCYYNSSLVMSATFSAGNTSTSGSFALQSKLLGISTQTTLTDEATDDVAAPNTPVISDNLVAEENVRADGNVDIYLSGISWMETSDNGTTYTFRGETWDMQTERYEKRVSTEKNAIVTVTSGVARYEYEVYIGSTKVTSGTTYTSNGSHLSVENVRCKENQSKSASYDYTLKLRVRAADHAGNWSGWEEKTVEAKYNPSVPSGHVVGVLDKPTVTVSEGNGIYRDGSTYYLRADGVTKLPLTLRATLSSTQKSRITSAALGNNNAKFNVQTPLTNHTASATKAGGGIGALSPSGNSTIHIVSDKETKVSQNFVTSREDTTYVYPYAEANCLGMWDTGCPNSTHTLDKQGTPIAIVGDKTAPTVTVTGKTFKDSGNYVDTSNGNWSSTNISLPVAVTDGGSGVASVEIRNEDGTTVTKSTPTGRTTNVTVPWTANTDGIKTYEIIAADNVGNTTTVNITVRINKQRPVITDNSSGVALNGSVKCMAGAWRSTSTNATWEYDWSLTRPLAYTVEDTVSGLKSVRFYQTSASYQGVVKNIFSGTYNGTSPVHIFYDVDTEGTSYYVIEAVNMSGNTTVVHVKARRDSTAPTFDESIRTVINFESFTMDKANEAVQNGYIPELLTTWVINWKDKNYGGVSTDSSGIQSATLYVYNANDTSDMKSYPMAVSEYGGNTSPRENDFDAPLDGSNRYYSKTFMVSISTFADFPYAAELKWYVEAKDNVGNIKRQYGKTDDGSDDIIPNFLVKAIAWATKDGAYNVKSEDGVTNTPYFKTGELGFLEVWTIGYVEGLELDFSDGSIGQEAAAEIARRAYDSKYALGVHGSADSSRLVTTIKEHGTSSGVPDRADGTPYATHYVYSYGDVNQSIGTGNTNGWNSDGTFVRIPPSHELTPRNEKDKYGNELYFWETNEARVYASKGSVVGRKYAKAPYIIWDESGDDVHYRIIHGTLGF